MAKLTQEQIQANKIEFINLLRSTGREGIETLINWLETKSDFFIAPSSTIYHGNYDGGLCQHSLNVYKAAKEFIKNSQTTALKEYELNKISDTSIIIAALLHDLCKTNFYVKEYKNFKDETTNTWKKYQTYKCIDNFPLGHGEKSVIMIQNFIKLTASEIIAIRWHMGIFDPGAFMSPYEGPALKRATDECPLLNILQIADYYASHLMEYTIDQKVENIIY